MAAYRFMRTPKAPKAVSEARTAIQLAAMIRRAENKLGLSTAKLINIMGKTGWDIPLNIRPWIDMKQAIIEYQEDYLDVLEDGIE